MRYNRGKRNYLSAGILDGFDRNLRKISKFKDQSQYLGILFENEFTFPWFFYSS